MVLHGERTGAAEGERRTNKHERAYREAKETAQSNSNPAVSCYDEHKRQLKVRKPIVLDRRRKKTSKFFRHSRTIQRP